MSRRHHCSDQGVTLALLTQHGKQDLVRPLLEPGLGCQLIHTDAYNTNLLGTFIRELERTGTQLDACRPKVRIGMELTAATLGLPEVPSSWLLAFQPNAGLALQTLSHTHPLAYR